MLFDWFSPNNILSAILMGVLISVLIGLLKWYQIRNWKASAAFFVIGIGVTLFTVGILQAFGVFN